MEKRWEEGGVYWTIMFNWKKSQKYSVYTICASSRINKEGKKERRQKDLPKRERERLWKITCAKLI